MAKTRARKPGSPLEEHLRRGAPTPERAAATGPATKAHKPGTPLEEHERTHPSDAAIAVADAQSADAQRSTGTVFVGCKLANGFVMEILEPGTLVDKDGKVMQGRRPAQMGKRIQIKGANSLRTDRRAAMGHPHPFAVTAVPKAFWDAWYARNKDRDYCRKGFVFAVNRATSSHAMADVQSKAKELMKERTGLEALATEKDPRLPLGRIPMLTAEVDPVSKPEGRQREEAIPV